MKFCRPLLPLVMALMSCQKPQPAAPAREMILHDSTLVFDTLRVDIRVPAGAVRADLLLLNGWNFPRTDWCDKSGFCAKALEQGYRLILPEMGKSVYHAHTWPETRKDWLAYPTGTQLFDSVIAQLANRYGILSGEVPAFVAGISTGGRGVALALVRKPGLFSGGVSLSGDFDQTTLPGDNLMTGYYGDYDRWPER